MIFETHEQNVESPEVFSSRIKLRFMRHDEKENDPKKSDYDIELTSKGRQHAKAQSEEVNLAQSVAFCSPRLRTQETAGFVMTGHRDEIIGDESFTQLREKVDRDINYGSKINVDPKLDFTLQENGRYFDEMLGYFKKGELMKFLVEKSDELARESGDNVSSTYSSMAASVASIILKYCGVAKRWDELVNDEEKHYDKTLNRFLATHQGVQESFLAKVIERLKGQGERNRFVTVLKNKGFDYAEGFETEVITISGQEPIIHVSYKKVGDSPEKSFEFDENVPLSLIKDIAERK